MSVALACARPRVTPAWGMPASAADGRAAAGPVAGDSVPLPPALSATATATATAARAAMMPRRRRPARRLGWVATGPRVAPSRFVQTRFRRAIIVVVAVQETFTPAVQDYAKAIYA